MFWRYVYKNRRSTNVRHATHVSRRWPLPMDLPGDREGRSSPWWYTISCVYRTTNAGSRNTCKPAILHHLLCLHFCITYFWNYLILPNNNKKGPGGIVRRIVLEISRANEIIQLLPPPSQIIENKFNTCLINTCSLYYPHNAPKDNLKSIIDNFYRSILSRKFLSPSFFHILTKSAQTIAVITVVHPSTLWYTACAPKESFNGVTWVEGE